MSITITTRSIERFAALLTATEHRPCTVSKYSRDVLRLLDYAGGSPLTKETLIGFKSELSLKLSPASVNTVIAAVNSYLDFVQNPALKLKSVKIQQSHSGERELTLNEYHRLIETADALGDRQTSLLMQTICSTGIRVSELPFITAEAVRAGSAWVSCKGKCRTVYLPEKLRARLIPYINTLGITTGAVFVTKNNKPLDRSNIYKSMQKLGRAAGIAPEKLFPHNLRHLFARTYYSAQKDIVRLADILGHSNLATTRIYIREDKETCAEQINALDLVLGTE